MYKIRLKIKGLYCETCAEHVSKTLHENFKIKGLEMNPENQIVVISSNKKIDKCELTKKIIRSGYGPVRFLMNMKGGKNKNG